MPADGGPAERAAAAARGTGGSGRRGDENAYRRGTAFKVTAKRALYLDFEPHCIVALPPSSWTTVRAAA